MLKKHLAVITAVSMMVTGVVSVYANDDAAGGTPENAPAQASVKTFSFDTDTIIRDAVPTELYGYNFESSNGKPNDNIVAMGGKFLADEYGKPNPEAKVMLEGYPFDHIRYGGASFMSYRWKEGLGSLWQRELFTTQIEDDRQIGHTRTAFADGDDMSNTVKRTDSVPEMIKLMQGMNPDISVTFCLNCGSDTLENQIDLVEFLTSDGSFNYNGGENWGKIRREIYGIEKVNMFAWDIGNEYNYAKGNAEEYIETVKKYIPAIRAIDKTTPIAVHQMASDEEISSTEWQKRLFIECGDMFDYIVAHKYFYLGTASGASEIGIRNVIKDINEYGDKDRHKLLLTEYNCNYSGNNALLNESISGAVAIGDYITRILHYPQVIEADFHGLARGGIPSYNMTGDNYYFRTEFGYYPENSWISYYTDRDRKIKAIPAVDVLRMFYQNSPGAKVIHSELEGFALGEYADATCAAFAQENGDICVFFTNLDIDKELTINIENSGYYLKSDVRIYGTKGPESINHYKRKEVNIDEKEYADKSECKQYTLSPLSFAMIRLSPIK